MIRNELLHEKEHARIQALKSLRILDTPIEERFERITRSACKIFQVPICAISCIDTHRQWFKSIQGSSTIETERCISFCQHTILQDGAFVIHDARLDPRFAQSPLVCDPEHPVVFYAGVPVYSPDGLPLAALCLNDIKPRSFDQEDIETLKDFAKLVESQFVREPNNPIERNLTHQIGEDWRFSMIDPLTRLWNHEGITTLIAEAINLAEDTRIGVGIGLLDLAHFAEINHQHGQVAGDEVLRSFSKAVLRTLGEDESVGRVQGDRYLMLFNSATTLELLEQQLIRVDALVDSYPVEGLKDRKTLGGTIAGIFIHGGCSCPLQAIFEQLDEAMSLAQKSVDQKPVLVELDAQKHTNTAGTSYPVVRD